MELPDFSKERVTFVGDLLGNERIYRHLIHRYGGTTSHLVDSRNTLLVVGSIYSELVHMHPRLNRANQLNIKLIAEVDFMQLLNPTI